MYNFDSLTLKYFINENKDFILNSIVQKIQLPTRYEVIFNLRNIKLAQNKKLYININPKYPHICFINEETQTKRNIEVPKKPPMFCMQLRKYLNGSKIKDVKCIKYERILELYFDYFDEIGSLSKICFCVEFMGKYSNIILYNVSDKNIIGTSHNVSSDKSSIRELYGGIKYIYPVLKNKKDVLKSSYAAFIQYNTIKDISENFYYLSCALLEKLKEDNKLDFQFVQELTSLKKPEYIAKFWGGDNVSDSIDNYFSEIIFDEKIKTKKTKLNKIVAPFIKKLNKIIEDAPDDKKAQSYKEQADYIMANLYNKDIQLPDMNITPQENAQKLYKLYKKAQNAFIHSTERIKEAKEKLCYYKEIEFSIENAQNFDELSEIENELCKNNEKIKSIPKISKIEYKGWDIFIGKNNKQNDYLISKIAQGEDLWFHGLNYPSAHIILKIPNNKKEPSKEVIEFCAKLTKENSKARSGGKASVIMTKRKNLKKPPNTYLGYVTYKNETEIII